MSGGDAKIREWLNRFASPYNVTKTALESRRKIGSNEYLKAKPEVDATTPEGKAALEEWRANAGIPKAAADYLPKGYAVDDAARPGVESFLGAMHAADAHPATVQAALKWRDQFIADGQAAQAEADKARRIEAEDKLHAEWGPEFRGNLTGVRTLFDTHGEAGLWDNITQARYPDGRRVGDDPAALRFLESLSREINPRGTIVPSGGADIAKTIEAELAALTAEAADSKGPYWRGPQAEAKQARKQQLLELQQKRAGRAA
jgi:hypothetical protein